MTNIIDNRENSGSARAAREIIIELSKNSNCEQVFIHFSQEGAVKDEIYLLPNSREIIIPYFKLPFGSHFFSFLIFFVTFRIKSQEKFDAIHWHWIRVYPFFWIIPAFKVFVTVHDANYRIIKEVSNFSTSIFYWNLRISQNKVDLFFADSEDASQKIVKYFKFKKQKVKHIYLATNFDKLTPIKPDKFVIPEQGYLICVSRWQTYKNVCRLVVAYENLLNDKQNIPKLILVGKPVIGQCDPLKIAKSKLLLNSLIVFSDLTDNELAYMYDHAKLNVTPSLNEGFGLSVLEGLARGCPSLDHLNTSTSEISGHAGMHIDMMSVSEIKSALREYIENKNLQKYLASQTVSQSKYFSWEKTARQLFEYYAEKLS